MKSTRSASRYAKALLEIAVEKSTTEQINSDMLTLLSAGNETVEFQQFLNSPIITPEKKNEVLKALFPNMDPTTISFLQLVVANKRENLLLQIAQSFIDQLKSQNGIVSVTLASATPLDAETKQKIQAKIQATQTGKIELIEEIDPSLLGGFVVKMGDNRIDASVANQLKNLKQRLTR